MVVAYDLDIAREKNDVGMRKLSDMAKKARLQGYEVIAVSASTEQKANSVKEEFDLPFDFYFCDETALKTIVRSVPRSEEHTSELQSRGHLVCRLLLEKK